MKSGEPLLCKDLRSSTWSNSVDMGEETVSYAVEKSPILHKSQGHADRVCACLHLCNCSMKLRDVTKINPVPTMSNFIPAASLEKYSQKVLTKREDGASAAAPAC